MESGETILVEIKPKKQTVAPKKPKRKTKKYVTEVTTYLTIPVNGKQLTNLQKPKDGSFRYGQKKL
jgi:hypothetical protein